MSNRIIVWTVVAIGLGAIVAFAADLVHDGRLARDLYAKMVANDPVQSSSIPRNGVAVRIHSSGSFVLASADESLTVGAAASATPAAAGAELSPEEIVLKLREQGYSDIGPIEWEHGRYEAKALDSEGAPVEVHVDPATGEVLLKKHKKAYKSTKTLKIKVTPEFRREFEAFAKNQGLSMAELLEEGFRLAKKRRSM